jgi:uncharacterized SAM-binding protein YcdF (DUF218 family)
MVDSSFGRNRYGSWARYRGWLAIIPAVLALGIAWAARASILRGAAELWVVSDGLGQADAIVVLGGGLDVRPFAAADLYKRGFAPQILVANVRLGPVEELKILPRHTELNRDVLVKLGVPSAAIIPFGEGVSNTYEEARAVRDWATSSGARSLIIPTEIFPARRVRWIFQHELAAAGVRVSVLALTPREYSREDWWRHEQGLITFQNELLKFVYYRFKY